MSQDGNPTIGVIGLGRMGAGIALSLLRGGHRLLVFDIRPEAVQRIVDAGGTPAESSQALVNACRMTITSLLYTPLRQTLETVLLPGARAGHVFVDTSTIPAPYARQASALLAARGAAFLDAPVTGGAANAEKGLLRMFVGGDRAAFEDCLPVLQACCKPEGVIYGGPSGMGQVLKIVQQLKNRLEDAVRLELISFALRAGLTPDLARKALGVQPGESSPYERLLALIEGGQGQSIDVVLSEWPYFLEEADARGIPMPALRALYELARDGAPVCPDGVGRMAPSLWHELSRRSR